MHKHLSECAKGWSPDHAKSPILSAYVYSALILCILLPSRKSWDTVFRVKKWEVELLGHTRSVIFHRVLLCPHIWRMDSSLRFSLSSMERFVWAQPISFKGATDVIDVSCIPNYLDVSDFPSSSSVFIRKELPEVPRQDELKQQWCHSPNHWQMSKIPHVPATFSSNVNWLRINFWQQWRQCSAHLQRGRLVLA